MGKKSKQARKRRREEQERTAGTEEATIPPSLNHTQDARIATLCQFLLQLDPLQDANVYYSDPLKSFRRALRPLLATLLENRGKATKKERKQQRKTQLEKKKTFDYWTTEESLDVLKGIFGDAQHVELSSHQSTIHYLRSLPSLEGKAFKQLRTVLHPFILALLEEENSSFGAQTSCAFRDGRQEDALRLLVAMRAAANAPKLGALQRWVRDCMNENDFAGLSSPIAVELLDAIVRLQPIQWAWKQNDLSLPADKILQPRMVRWCPPFAPHPRLAPVPIDPVEINCLPSTDSGKVDAAHYTGRYGTRTREARVQRYLKARGVNAESDYACIHFEKGADRRPRNRYDLEIYTAADRLVQFDPALDQDGAQTLHEVPSVPGAVLIANVLSPQECEEIIAMAEGSPKGYVPDEPLTSAPPPPGFAPRASNFVVLSKSITAKLFERTKRHMPMNGGPEEPDRVLAGLNERLRLYRYQPGAIYRPHVSITRPSCHLSI
jgi:hypothetical protein